MITKIKMQVLRENFPKFLSERDFSILSNS